MRTTLLAMILTAAAASAAAGPPTPGVYKSTNGDFPGGRYSLSWVGGVFAMDNSLHVESWDPATGSLATSWRLYCTSIVSPPFLAYSDVGPDGGSEIYFVEFDSDHSRLWLSADGPWGNGEDYRVWSYVGTVGSIVTYHYLPGPVLENIEWTLDFFGELAGYYGCMARHVTGTVAVGDTDHSPFPVGEYPILQSRMCNAGPTEGSWGVMSDVIITTSGCTLDTQETSWGEVKVMYR